MNVIFELGYFLGLMKRYKGKVFLLKKGNIEIPSDLSGIIYIDISDGVISAREEIKKELQEWI
jgi:predicted nucleotide-binding protein